MRLEPINVSRYYENGQSAEECVQYDRVGFLRQLNADLTEGD
ncbi:hypothetical protein ACFYWO_36905 [Streptomyces sp. NPDC002932]